MHGTCIKIKFAMLVPTNILPFSEEFSLMHLILSTQIFPNYGIKICMIFKVLLPVEKEKKIW